MTGPTLRNVGEERARRKSVPGVWRTFGYRLESWDVGRAVVAWDADEAYGFPTAGGYVVQGGLVTAVLDAAMASACWSVLDEEHTFLTADLRVEFQRSARVGLLVATGVVERATSRVVFCSADLHDTDGRVLASSRCTQVVLPSDHPSRRRLGPTD